jgi:prolipoprotein diacylglyceryltransferase
LESDISKLENQNINQNNETEQNPNQNIEIGKSGKLDGLQSGDIGAIYLILYGIGRFAIEFLRDDLRGAVGALSTSQFISLFIVAGGIVILVLHRTFDKKSFKRDA